MIISKPHLYILEDDWLVNKQWTWLALSVQHHWWCVTLLTLPTGAERPCSAQHCPTQQPLLKVKAALLLYTEQSLQVKTPLCGPHLDNIIMNADKIHMIKRICLWSWAPLPVGEKYILTLEVSVFLMFALTCETCTPVIRTIGLQWQKLQALRAKVFIALTIQQSSCNSTTHASFLSLYKGLFCAK